ncbi:hypothetical protein P12x_000957 [Tundrisphaera lichenicola]|uniref:hypothetical protein n=1 Tax=Tundrisphaera lichenicola TaxID=2029860 RepID=UPI003EBDD212
MIDGKSDTVASVDRGGKAWPTWARVLVTLALLYHASAVWVAAWAPPPSSELERDLDVFFDRYQQLTAQGYSPRYYSPEPPPTPVITATLAFADGRAEKVVRIPERGTWPRLLYQRQLALANGLFQDASEAREFGDASRSRWAHAFATHLGRVNPGCSSVTLQMQLHLVPSPDRAREWLARPGAGPVDLDADEFYTAPERIGVFPCDAS